MRTGTGLRTRWAAIGAACAVALGGGVVGVVRATVSTGDRSAYFPIAPTRVLDTRGGATIENSSIMLTVEGNIAVVGESSRRTVVPTDASAIAINLTVTSGRKNGDYGYVTAFPCTSASEQPPNASSLNFENGIDLANALSVTTSSTGSICLYVYGTAHLIVDVAGYFADHDHDDRYYTKAQVDTMNDEMLDELSSVGERIDQETVSLVKLMTTPPHAINWEASRISGSGGKAFGIAVKPDGNPIISYTDNGNDKALRVINCNEPTCLLSTEINTIDDQTSVLGPWTTIAIGLDGNPVMAYTDANNNDADLKFAACVDVACRQPAVVNVLDSAGTVGWSPSLVITADGNPFIAYQDATNNNLKIVACNDPRCSGGDEYVRTLDGNSDTTRELYAALDFTRRPVIAYSTLSEVRYIRCLDTTCSTNNAPVTIDTIGGSHLAMEVSPSGSPVMVYGSSAGFKVARCGGIDCTLTPTIQEFTKTSPTFSFDIVIGINDLPIVVFNENFDLKVMYCDDPACSGVEARTFVVDANGNDGIEPVAALLPNGVAVVAYFQFAYSRVKFASLLG